MRRRFESHAARSPELVRGLPADHPAVVEGRTLFPSTVVSPTASPRLLVSGVNQRKLGSHVTKGAWAGMPIYALTLEERKTCPTTCHHWTTCYGSGMQMARRHEHGPELEFLLARELEQKQLLHPSGFVVRLHVLGDFYDAAYVALWGRWLAKFEALRVFGFTAREESSDEGILLRSINLSFPDRFAIRFSAPSARGVAGVRYATVIREIPEQPVVDGAVVCPAQTGRTETCGTCGICWASQKNVAFILHGRGTRMPGFDAADGVLDDDAMMMRASLPQPGAPAVSTGRGPGRNPAARREATQGPRHVLTGIMPAAARHPDGLPIPDLSQVSTQQMDGIGYPFDPVAAVPLRAVEIRAWLKGVGREAPASDARALVAAANKIRDELNLPPFRLIPEHEGARYQEVIMPIQRSRLLERTAGSRN